jgi:hypothetical protein
MLSVVSLAYLSLGQPLKVQAEQSCEPFVVTTTVIVAPTGNPGEFSLDGSGGGTIGDAVQTGLIQFKLVGRAIHFRSLTVISTDTGDLYTAEAGNATVQGSVGSYRILGGTGAWEGASGSGSFRVDANPDGTQTASYLGTICR